MKSGTLDSKVVLITGGAGFIGSNLCEELLQKGSVVLCVDNLSTGFYKNIESLEDHPNFQFLKIDITDFDAFSKACRGVDIILHQAALGSVPRSIDNPINTNKHNVDGFLNVLWAAVKNNIRRVVYASSSSVYGTEPTLPKIEERIGMPISPYAVSKRTNELYADVFARLYNLNIIGLRYFNVFGKNQSPDGAYAAAIPRFIDALLSHKSPVIYGDGQQSRDFTYIKNVVQANVLAATTINTEALNTVYNVAYGGRTTINTIVESLRDLLSVYDPRIGDIEIRHQEERKGDVKHSNASIEKIRRNLGYDPQYDIKAGLREAIDWYIEQHNTSKDPELKD
ncbi:MAG: SDR family oxidoreductase [Flavobacteriales bacterium]|nr:SDR family oxidoreductase [Flavobacteriales bacterium]